MGLYGLVKCLQLVGRKADVLEPDVTNAQTEGGLQMLRGISDCPVVAGQNENEAKSHYCVLSMAFLS